MNGEQERRFRKRSRLQGRYGSVDCSRFLLFSFFVLRLAGWLTRVLLLVPLLIGARIDCGAELTSVGVSSQSTEPDCHHESGVGDPRDESPALPQHHQHAGLPGGHCPVFHSCALDFALLANSGTVKSGCHAAQLPPCRTATLPHFDQLPEVPPPRA